MKRSSTVMLVVIVACALAFVASPASAALPGAESLAKLIIHEFDTNTNDAVDAGEWQTGITGSFDQMDANGDEFINPDEVGELTGDIADQAGELAAGLIIALIKQVILSLDSDGDKLVSQKEYATLSTDIFTRLDADKDNTLSLAELSELPVKVLLE